MRAPQYATVRTRTGRVSRLKQMIDGADDVFVRSLAIDDEALWSFTSFHIGRDICRLLLSMDDISRASTVTDAFAGAGGMAIQFGRYFASVAAIELNVDRKAMLDTNLLRFSISSVRTFAGYFQSVSAKLTQDIIFFDPPWGVDYRWTPHLRITITGPRGEMTPLETIVANQRAKYAVLKLPFNYDIDHLIASIAHVGSLLHRIEYPRPNTMTILIIKYYFF